MADRLTIEIQDAELRSRLGEAISRLERPHDLMTRIGDVLAARAEWRFEHQVDPDGAPWAPLLESTLERKRKLGKPSLALVLDGYLEGSVQANATDHAVEVGYGMEYARFHETGTRHMPRRALLTSDWKAGALGDADRSAVLTEVENWLLKVF